jgi:hypothetical protein
MHGSHLEGGFGILVHHCVAPHKLNTFRLVSFCMVAKIVNDIVSKMIRGNGAGKWEGAPKRDSANSCYNSDVCSSLDPPPCRRNDIKDLLFVVISKDELEL